MARLSASEADQPAQALYALPLPQHVQSPETRMLGEAIVATINAHLQRYSAMSWAEVRAVLRVLERAAEVEVVRELRRGRDSR